MTELTGFIQAVLFAAAEPLSLATLTEATGHPEEDVRAALDELAAELSGTGLALQLHAERWQLVTSPAAASSVKRYLAAEARTDLSRAALETLAMIAYRGPIARSSLDELRGVSSDAMIRNLLQRGLISEQGRPTRYVVSHRFLEHVGLSSLADLPPLDDSAPHEA